MNSLLRLRLQVEVKGMEQFAAVKGALAQMQKQVNAAAAGGGKTVAATGSAALTPAQQNALIWARAEAENNKLRIKQIGTRVKASEAAAVRMTQAEKRASDYTNGELKRVASQRAAYEKHANKGAAALSKAQIGYQKRDHDAFMKNMRSKMSMDGANLRSATKNAKTANAVIGKDNDVLTRRIVANAKTAASASAAAARGGAGGGRGMAPGVAAATGGWSRFTSTVKASMTKTDPDKFFHSWNRSLIGMGKQVQWTGRQLEYNFTLPLMRAGRAILELGKKNEEGLTRIVKVYGTGTDVVEGFTTQMLVLGQNMTAVDRNALKPGELTAYDMGRAFRSLSDIFGISIDQVSALGAKWAAAGATGANLAKSVRLTMEAMLVGDFADTEEAFNTLIGVQAAYELETHQMTAAMAVLNTVENVSAASFTDLSKVVARAGATARTAGVDLTELAAIASALVPATGSAETAGNGLKTLFSRLLVPTADAAELMAKMGINTEDTGWISQTVTQRLETMAGAFSDLTQPQKAVVSAFVAGRYQLNRFEEIMSDIVNPVGNFRKSMNALSGDLTENGQVMKQYRRELTTLLASNPKQMEILKTRIQNVANEVVVHLYPTIIMVTKAISDLARRFSELTPAQKQLIMMALGFLAVIGPVMRVGGAVAQLGGVIMKVFTGIGKAIFMGAVYFGKFVGMIGGLFVKIGSLFWTVITGIKTGMVALAALLGIPFWALAAIIAVILGVVLLTLYHFRDQAAGPFRSLAEKIKSFFAPIGKFFARVFNSLPAPVKNAMLAVLRIVQATGKAIYKALSYLNPFAKHSPSLVEQVIKGVDLIASKYASLSNIGRVFRQATSDLEDFKDAIADALLAQGKGERNEQRVEVAAVVPAALPEFDNLVVSYDALKLAAADVKYEMDEQQAVVNALQTEFDDLGRSIAAAERTQRALEVTATSLKDRLEAAQSALAAYADAPLEGMGAMEDAIFANTMAQKQLQLEMMNMEDAVGPMDDLADRLALLAGEIEQLQGLQEDLRRAGAGSEITGPIQDQIDALEDQRAAIGEQTAPLQGMQDELDALGRAATRLDLENSLQFDPLNRQIDQLTSTMQEMPFDQVVAGISAEQAKVITLTAAYDQANAAVAEQKLQVDTLNAARDAMDARLDIEKRKLEELANVYRDMENLLREIEEAFGALSAAASDARAAMEEGGAGAEAGGVGDQFDIAGTGDFDEGTIGGVTEFGEDTGLEDLANSYADEADKMFEGLDPFKKLREKWATFQGWFKENVTSGLSSMLGGMGGEGGAGDAMVGMWDKVRSALAFLGPIADGVKGAFEKLWAVLTSGAATFVVLTVFFSFVNLLKSMWGFIKDVSLAFWNELAPAFEGVTDLVQPLIKAWGRIAIVGAVIVGVALLIVAAWWKVEAFLIDHLKPVFEAVFGTMGEILNAVIDIWKHVVGLVTSLINGDWKDAWDHLLGIFIGIWDYVFAFLRGIPRLIWTAFSAVGSIILDALGNLGGLLFDWVKLGFQFVMDHWWEAVTGLWGLFLALGPLILSGLVGLGGLLWDWIKAGFDWAVSSFGSAMSGLADLFTGLAGSLLSGMVSLGGALLGWLVDAFIWVGSHWLDAVGFLIGFVTGLPFDIINALIALGPMLYNWIKDATLWVVDHGLELVGNLVGWLADLPGAIWGWFSGLKDTFFGGVDAGVQGVADAGPTLIGKLVDWLKALPDKVWEGVKAAFTFVVTKGPELIGEVVGFLLGLPGIWLDTLLLSVGWVADAFMAAFNFITDNMDDRAKGVIGAVGGLAVKFAGGLKDLGWNLLKAFGRAFLAVVTALPGIIHGVMMFFLKMPIMVPVWLFGMAATLVNFFLETFISLVTAMPGIIAGLITWFMGLPALILNTLLTVITWLWQTGIDLLTGLWNGIMSFLPTLIGWWLALPTLIFTTIGDVLKSLWDKGTDLIRGIYDAVVEKAPEILNWFKDLPGVVFTKLGDVTRTLASKGWDLLLGILKGIGEKEIELWNWLTGLPETVKSKVGDAIEWLRTKGRDIVEGILKGIGQKAWELWEWLTNVAQWVKDKVGYAGEWLKDAGVDMIKGLIKGILSWAGDGPGKLVDTVTGVAKGAISVFKSAVGASSPSKVFMAIGHDIGDGLILGIEDSQRAVNLALAELADPSAFAAQMGMSVKQHVENVLPNVIEPKTLIFNGDLVLPNISSGEDADLFIRNLEVLAAR